MGGSYERNKETHQTYRQHNDFDQRRMSSTSVQIVINIYTSDARTKTITIVVWILAAASARRRIVSGSLTKTITIVVWILSAAASARRRIVSGSLTARGALAVGPGLLTSLASYASFNSVNLRVDLLHGNFTGLFGGVALIHELVNYVPTTILQHLVNIVVASGAK